MREFFRQNKIIAKIKQYRRRIAVGIVFLLPIALITVLPARFWDKINFFSIPRSSGPTVQLSEVTTSEIDAYELALSRAREWDSAALPSKIHSTSGSIITDQTRIWELSFISENKKGAAYLVEVDGRSIINEREISFFGQGAALPQQFLTAEEAISRAREVAGYENEPIISTEMTYNPDAEQWRWGVRTSKGTISINAKK